MVASFQLGPFLHGPLSRLPNLRELWLANTKVTDRGLVKLRNLRNLRTLVLFGTGVSRAEVDKLRGALGGCQILY